MTLNQSALLQLTEALRTADNGDVMRQMLGFMLQSLVDAEATSVIGAAPHERTEERTTHRNGTRPKTVSTAAGDLTVKIPKLRQGSFFPTLLEPRRRVDVALHAVIMEAYVHGVSTRKGRRPGDRARCRHRNLEVRGISDLCRSGCPGR